MRRITDPSEEVAGGKARALLLLHELFDVPPFVVVGMQTAEIDGLSDVQVLGYTDSAGVAAPFAVRSTFAREDGTAHAYPGVFQTCLNVHSDHVAAAVSSVVRSAHTDIVDAYVLGAGAPAQGEDEEVAVLIQSMCDADAAGVCFTGDSKGNTSECRVEAVRGLGEALVSGRVEPDAYRFERATGAVIEYLPGRQTHAITSRGEELLTLSESVRRKISSSTARKVFDLALEVESALDQAPVDIEWCLVGDRLYLLQARPLTTRE